MSDLPQVVQVAARRWLEPLVAASRDSSYRRDVFRALGLDADAFDDNEVARLAVELGKAAEALDSLASIDIDEPSLETLAAVLAATEAGVAAAQSVAAIAADVDDAAGDALTVLERLFGFLTVGYLARYAPAAYEVAALLTLIRADDRRDGELPRLELGRLPALVEDPGLLAREYLGPEGLAGLRTQSDAIAAADRLLPRVAAVLRRAGVNARYSRDPRLPLPTDAGIADRRMTVELPLGPGAGVGLLLSIRSGAEGGAGFVLAPFGAARIDHEGLGWTFSFELEGSVRGLAVGRDGVEFPAGAQDLRLEVRAAALKRQGPGGVAFRSSATGNRLEIGGLGVRAVAVFAEDYEIDVLAELEGAALVLTGGDGLLEQILPPGGLRIEFELALGWSRRKGLFFAGAASLDAVLAIHRLFGPLRIELIHLSSRAGPEGLTGRLATTVALTLGPVVVALERTGLVADISFPPEGGNLGPAALALRAEPPAGAAMTIDAGAVTGGGFLSFDPEMEQYAGGLHLEFEGISLNAFGLLTTRMPDGSKGFSLLVMVQASGFEPVPLGFGFTLTGVGGLLGINRTVAVDVLRVGIRTRALDSILFSQDDPTPRAPQIVSTLQSVFPPASDQYVFGPMVQIAWGPPPNPLLTIEVALILELPAPLRLIVLGRVQASLPTPTHAIVKLRLDLVGVIDFDRRQVAVDATLYDSFVGPFALTGDMAARGSWGDQADFAMALGGFHPAFRPPEGFPELRRLALTLSSTDNPRLRMEAYLALTSNTVQIGARLDFYVAAAGFSLEGGFGFDTLITLSPFRLQAEIGAGLTLKRGSTTLAHLGVHMNLVGPAPWEVWGTATISILLLDISVPFHATFGEPQAVPEPERVDVWALLHGQLSHPSNWSTQLPPEDNRLATLAALPGDGAALVHPLGALSVTQRLVPLERTLSLFGTAPPLEAGFFEITGGDGLVMGDDVYDYFAPAQFRRMTDAEKLSSPSFDRMVSGAQFGPRADAVVTGTVQEAPLAYETALVLDLADPTRHRDPGPYRPAGDTVASIADRSPAGLAELRDQGREKFAPPTPGPSLAEPEYVVATRDTLATEVDGYDGTYSGAVEALRRRGDAELFQIVRREETELATL